MKDLPGLKSLQLGSTGITDAGLAKLAGVSKMENLDLGGTQITDAGLAHSQWTPELADADLGPDERDRRGPAAPARPKNLRISPSTELP